MRPLEAALDPETIRHLVALGVTDGWHCLEVGAGGGSVAEWFCQRVGPKGRVVATDLETKPLEAIAAHNLEVRRHDITVDNLEEEAFDLVHCRGVLEHLPARQAALKRMVAALNPGGWVLVEASDYVSCLPTSLPGADLFMRGMRKFLELYSSLTGFDAAYGRRLRAELLALGMTAVNLDGYIFEWGGDLPQTSIWLLPCQELRDRIIEEGLLYSVELDEFLFLLDAPDLIAMSHIMVADKVRKPKK